MTEKAVASAALSRPKRPLRTVTLAVMAVTAALSALLAWSLAGEARYAFSRPTPVDIGDFVTADPAPHEGSYVRAHVKLEEPVGTYRRPFEPTRYRVAKVEGTADRWVIYPIPDGFPEARFLPPHLVAGRLVRGGDLGARFRGVRDLVGDGWVVVDGEDPYGQTWVVGLEAMLLGFVAFNVLSIVRLLRRVA